MLSKSKIFVTCQIRWYSAGANPKLSETLNTLLDNKELKHRQHPGIIKKNVITLPTPILNAMKIILEDFPNRRQLYAESITFRNQLHNRHKPLEEKERNALYEHTHARYLRKENLKNATTEELQLQRKKNERKVLMFVKQWANHWQEIVYDVHKSLLYMIGRSVPNYAVLHAIFNEIRIRDEKFKPKTVLDFGSGIGTTVWTINELWPKEVKEFVNVDISNEINNLSQKITKILYPNFTGIFYRQFMPMSLRPNYDITVSAFSLIELPNTKSRLDTVMKLWKKTKNYLVIVEEGTDAGFQIVTEARDFILHLSNLNAEETNSEETNSEETNSEETNSVETNSEEANSEETNSVKTNSEETHVFAPCPHDFDCPKTNVCYFEAGYNSVPFLGKLVKYERYSYVVLKKGAKLENGSDWPRLISAPLKRGKHVICRMCCSSGDLKQIIFTRSKHGKNLYRCARLSKWGDRLPLEANFESDTTVDIDSDCENDENDSNIDTEENEDITEYKDETIK